MCTSPRSPIFLISGDKIERIAPAIDAPDGVEVIEAAGKLVVPGFVNSHYHSHDVLLKGMFEEMPFDIWALHTNAASYGRRSLHELRIRTLIGAAEMLRNGITTVQDFLTVYPADEAIVDTVLSAYAEAGIRVVFAIAARDRAALDIAPLMTKELPEGIRQRLVGTSRPAKEELDFVSGQIKRLGMQPRPLTTWALAPSAPQRCSPELLEGIAALSREHGLPVFTHVYETRPQAAAAHVQSSSLLDVLANAGLMNERLNLVHGVWLSRATSTCLPSAARAWCTIRSAISSSRAAWRRSSISIAPASPSRSAATTTVAPRRRTSSSPCGCCACFRRSPLRSRIRSPPPMRSRPRHSTGAKACSMEGQIGALKAGMAADLMILDLKEPAFVPFNSAARQIVFSEAGRAVETVLVGGPAGGARTQAHHHRRSGNSPPRPRSISPGFRREARRDRAAKRRSRSRRCSRAIARLEGQDRT